VVGSRDVAVEVEGRTREERWVTVCVEDTAVREIIVPQMWLNGAGIGGVEEGDEGRKEEDEDEDEVVSCVFG
jgi:hypothetical protein